MMMIKFDQDQTHSDDAKKTHTKLIYLCAYPIERFKWKNGCRSPWNKKKSVYKFVFFLILWLIDLTIAIDTGNWNQKEKSSGSGYDDGGYYVTKFYQPQLHHTSFI